MEISDFKDLHGGPVAILGNGPSMLKDLPGEMPTIGMNASIHYCYSDYWVGLDLSSTWMASTAIHKPKYHFTITGVEIKEAENIVLNANRDEPFGWSNDLAEVVYPGRATIWFALQLAVYMGFDPIYLTGFELWGPRPDKHINAGSHLKLVSIHHQLQLMGYLRALMDTGVVRAKIFNLSSGSLCTAIPLFPPGGDSVSPPIQQP